MNKVCPLSLTQICIETCESFELNWLLLLVDEWMPTPLNYWLCLWITCVYTPLFELTCMLFWLVSLWAVLALIYFDFGWLMTFQPLVFIELLVVNLFIYWDFMAGAPAITSTPTPPPATFIVTLIIPQSTTTYHYSFQDFLNDPNALFFNPHPSIAHSSTWNAWRFQALHAYPTNSKRTQS
jgi:hypothetical protein